MVRRDDDGVLGRDAVGYPASRWDDPAGASPASVSGSAPSSRPPERGEILGSEAGVESPTHESAAGSKHAGRNIKGKPTKTGKASLVPVHPVLAEMLTSWRHGWARLFGRPPGANDAIVPRAPGRRKEGVGSPHTKKTGADLMDVVLQSLEIPPAPMKAHALRSTFVSMALEDGADDRLLERITHSTGRGHRAFDRYDRADWWPQLCAEVSKLRISSKSEGRYASLRTAHGTAILRDSDVSGIEWRRRESNR